MLGLGLGLQKSIAALNAIINKIQCVLYADKTTDGLVIDRIGRTTFDPVRPAYAVGDGATYFEIEDEDGVQTEIDLGTSHTIEFEAVIVGLTSLPVIFIGRSTTTSDCVLIRDDVSVRYRMNSNEEITLEHGIVDNNYHVFKILRSIAYIELYVDGELASYKNITTSGTFTTDMLMGFLAGLYFTGSCSYINLNDQYIFNPQALGSNDFIKLQRTSESLPELYAQQYVQPATPTIEDDSLAIGSPLNEDGYIVAQALGKNLLNNAVWQEGTYVNSINGSLASTPGTRTSYRILVEPNTDYYVATDDRAVIRYEDEDENLLDWTTDGGTLSFLQFTTPADCRYIYVYYSRNGTNVDEVQLEQGSTATTYEPWEGYYLEDTLTTPYPDGTPIQRILGSTKADAWVSDGAGGSELADCDIGRVKFNPRIVDGVADLLIGSVTEVGDMSYTIIRGSVVVANETASTSDRIEKTYNLSNAVHTLVTKAKKNSGTDAPQITIRNLANTSSIANVVYTTEEVETRTLFTPTDGGGIIRFFATNATSEIAEKEYYDFAIYEGDYVTDTPPLPTSATFEDGNSWVLDTAYNQAVKADGGDGLDGDYVYDETDPTAVTSKVIPCDTASRGDYIFTSLTKGIVALYDTVQTGDTLAKIKSKLGIS